MSSSFWPTEDGWPYPDQEGERAGEDGEVDHDVLLLRSQPLHVLDSLDPLERQVVCARFGLGNTPVRTVKQLGADLGLARADVKQALGSGLRKLRAELDA